MALPLIVNGVTYEYPETDDTDWGPDATDWAQAVTLGMLQKAGGLFQLLAETDFGTAFGIKSLYYKSRTTNPADAGQIRIARADVINWRNQANDGNLSLGVSASNVLQFNGANIQNSLSVTDTSTIDLTFVADTLSADIVTGSILDAMINAAAAINATKIADGSVSNTEFQYLNGVSSAIQTQLDGKASTTLNNLGTTAINADLNPSGFRGLGTDTDEWGWAYIDDVYVSNLGDFDSVSRIGLATDDTLINAVGTGSVKIGDDLGSRKIQLIDATIGTANQVFKSIDAFGTGSWSYLSNASIDAAAAIAFSKLAALSSANILVGSAGNVATSVAVTGDVTISNAGVTAIGANKVLNSMLNQMAQSTFKGRAASSGTGDPVDLTATQATAILNNMVGDSGSGGTKGLVPAPAAGDTAAGKFLRADGTWVAPSGAGDVVGPASSTDSGFAKFDGTTGKLLKNSPATISNADVNASAAIARTKLASGSNNHVVINDGSGVMTSEANLAQSRGGTGNSTYTDGQLLIGKTSDGSLQKATLTAGANITVTNGAGAITIAAASTAIPAWTYVSQTSTLNPAVAGRYYVLSGASFNITLPAASGVTAGQGFYFEHGGTSLTQVYTYLTTGGDTIGGIASGSYAFYTNGEGFYLVSNGSDGYRIAERKTLTAEVNAGVLAVTASSAYTFTLSGAATITAGTVYTANGNTFIISTASSASTTLLAYGTGSPGASGTLTFVSGSPSGNLTFNSVATSAPVYGTVTYNRFLWSRAGTDLVGRWECSATGNGTNGTGQLAFYYPTGLLPNTTNMSQQTTVLAAAHPVQPSLIGHGFGFGSAVNAWSMAYNSWPTLFQVWAQGNGGWNPSTFNVLQSTSRWTLQMRYPVNGWQP